jgi:hypothetical protein
MNFVNGIMLQLELINVILNYNFPIWDGTTLQIMSI